MRVVSLYLIMVITSHAWAEEIKYVPCSLEVRTLNMILGDRKRTVEIEYRVKSDRPVRTHFINHIFSFKWKDGTETTRRYEDVPHTQYHTEGIYIGRVSAHVSVDLDKMESARISFIRSALHPAYQTKERLRHLDLESIIWPVPDNVDKDNDGFFYLSERPKPSTEFDLNGDGEVGIVDFLIFVDSFGTFCNMATFDARMDYNGNGEIEVGDFLLFAGRFGK